MVTYYIRTNMWGEKCNAIKYFCIYYHRVIGEVFMIKMLIKSLIHLEYKYKFYLTKNELINTTVTIDVWTM